MKALCYSIVTCAERLNRAFSEMIKHKLEQEQILDLNCVQALLIYNIAEQTFSIGDLTSCGLYNGSNVSYNLKKLIQKEYLIQSQVPHDKRSSFVKLSEKGMNFYEKISDLILQQEQLLCKKFTEKKLQTLNKDLYLLESEFRSGVQLTGQDWNN